MLRERGTRRLARAVDQEVRAVLRGRFALLGAALLLAVVTLLAALLGTSASARIEFLWPAYLVLPTMFIPIAALSLSQARHSRFVHGVFTTPTTASAFFGAKVASMLALGLAYLLCLTPFLVVQALHGVVDAQMTRYAWAGAAMVFHAVTLGILIGVLFTARGSLATLATSVAAMVGTVVAMVVAPDMRLTSAAVRRALHASGGVLAQDALGIGDWKSTAGTEAAVGYWILTLGCLLGAWWIFVRHQSPEGWETSAGRGLLVASCLVAVVGAPVALAGTQYKEHFEDYGYSYTSGEGMMLRVLPRGSPLPARWPPWYEDSEIVAGRASDVDLFVFVHPAEGVGDRWRDLTMLLEGEGLDVRPRTLLLGDVGPLPSMDPGTGGAQPWPYVRVPVTLIPAAPTTLRDNYHFLSVQAAFVGVDGKGHEAAATDMVVSNVPNAELEMWSAGAPAPLSCTVAFGARKIRMR